MYLKVELYLFFNGFSGLWKWTEGLRFLWKGRGGSMEGFWLCRKEVCEIRCRVTDMASYSDPNICPCSHVCAHCPLLYNNRSVQLQGVRCIFSDNNTPKSFSSTLRQLLKNKYNSSQRSDFFFFPC